MSFNPNERMTKIKGKDYLEVKWRLVWFREEHPDWNLDTTLLHSDETTAIFSCKIYDQTGRQVSSGHGSESTKDWNDYIEKAETKAIGRALAMLGYGTQFAPELDEGERIVDAPVNRKNHGPTPEQIEWAKKYVVPFGAHQGEELAAIYKTDRAHIDILYKAATGKTDTNTMLAIETLEWLIKNQK